MIGDKVTIKREVLGEDQQFFPYGTVVAIKDERTVVIELDFLEEQVEVDIKNIRVVKDKKK